MPDPISSAAVGIYSSDKAADAQVDAARQSSATQMAMFNQTRADNMPWMQAGKGGLNALMQLYGMQGDGAGGWNHSGNNDGAMAMLQQDPSYQFRLQQGQGVLENSAAARGGMLSGNALRALSDYGQNTASQEYGNIANRFAGLAGVGQGSAQYIGQAGMNTGAGVGANQVMAGQARASGYMGRYGAVNNATDQFLKLGGMVMGAGMGGGA